MIKEPTKYRKSQLRNELKAGIDQLNVLIDGTVNHTYYYFGYDIEEQRQRNLKLLNIICGVEADHDT